MRSNFTTSRIGVPELIWGERNKYLVGGGNLTGPLPDVRPRHHRQLSQLPSCLCTCSQRDWGRALNRVERVIAASTAAIRSSLATGLRRMGTSFGTSAESTMPPVIRMQAVSGHTSATSRTRSVPGVSGIITSVKTTLIGGWQARVSRASRGPVAENTLYPCLLNVLEIARRKIASSSTTRILAVAAPICDGLEQAFFGSNNP
jgi:hypothetical protein